MDRQTDRLIDRQATNNRRDKHEQSGLPLCVTAFSYSLNEVNEKHVHIHTEQRCTITPTNQGLLFVLVEPEDQARPLQSTGLISELAHRRLSYGTPYAWMDIVTGRAGGPPHVSICDCVCIRDTQWVCRQVKTHSWFPLPVSVPCMFPLNSSYSSSFSANRSQQAPADLWPISTSLLPLCLTSFPHNMPSFSPQLQL